MAVIENENEVAIAITHNELSRAFDAVRNPADWRAPIDALVSIDDLATAMLAIEYFTATKPTICSLAEGRKVRIQAIGYRMGPAGP